MRYKFLSQNLTQNGIGISLFRQFTSLFFPCLTGKVARDGFALDCVHRHFPAKRLKINKNKGSQLAYLAEWYTLGMDDMAKPPGLAKRGSVYYYRRRIPNDLIEFYGGKEVHKKSLRTNDHREAVDLAQIEAARLSAQFVEDRRRFAGLIPGTNLSQPGFAGLVPV